MGRRRHGKKGTQKKEKSEKAPNPPPPPPAGRARHVTLLRHHGFDAQPHYLGSRGVLLGVALSMLVYVGCVVAAIRYYMSRAESASTSS